MSSWPTGTSWPSGTSWPASTSWPTGTSWPEGDAAHVETSLFSMRTFDPNGYYQSDASVSVGQPTVVLVVYQQPVASGVERRFIDCVNGATGFVMRITSGNLLNILMVNGAGASIQRSTAATIGANETIHIGVAVRSTGGNTLRLGNDKVWTATTACVGMTASTLSHRFGITALATTAGLLNNAGVTSIMVDTGGDPSNAEVDAFKDQIKAAVQDGSPFPQPSWAGFTGWAFDTRPMCDGTPDNPWTAVYGTPGFTMLRGPTASATGGTTLVEFDLGSQVWGV